MDTISCWSELVTPPETWSEWLVRAAKEAWSVPHVAPLVRATAVMGAIVGGGYVMYPLLRQPVRCYRVVRTMLGMEPIVHHKPLGTRVNCLESLRAGSIESQLVIPKFQLMIGNLTDGVFSPQGAGLRFREWLVMPAHVYSSVPEPYVKGLKCLSLKGCPYEDLDTDLIAIKLADRDWSQLAAPTAVISQVIPDKGVYVAVVGVVGRGTTGVLRHDPSVFGRVCYEGTTLGGYSGAAYTSGSQLVGVHTNGGAVNGGFSASYVWMLLNQKDKIKAEESEDWLRQAFQQGTRIKVDLGWGSPDEIRVRVGGKYAVVERSSMAKAFGPRWQVDIAGDEILRDAKRSYESLSGNSQDSMMSGASSTLAQSPEIPSTERLELMEMLAQLSNARCKLVRSVLTAASSTPRSVVDVQPQGSTSV